MARKINFAKVTANAKRSTINLILRKSRVQTVQEVRKVYNIKSGDMKKAMVITRASNQKQEGLIKIKGTRLPLDRFAARKRVVKTGRGKRVGVTVRVKKSGGRKLVRQGFQGKLRNSGKVTVFKRVGRARLPIRRLTTTSPAKMFEKEAEKKLFEIFERELPIIFDRQLMFYLNR